MSDEDMARLADAALDEPTMAEMLDLVKGGPEGFAETAAVMRARTAQLAAEVPNVRNVLSSRRKKAFLIALSQTGNVGMACAAAGWTRGAAYSIRKADEDFRDQWEFALESAVDVMHAAAFQRAVHGVQENVWHKDKDGAVLIDTVTKYDSSMLMFLMKAHDRAKYGDKQDIKHEGSKGGVLVVPGTMSLDEWTVAADEQQAKFREKQEI